MMPLRGQSNPTDLRNLIPISDCNQFFKIFACTSSKISTKTNFFKHINYHHHPQPDRSLLCWLGEGHLNPMVPTDLGKHRVNHQFSALSLIAITFSNNLLYPPPFQAAYNKSRSIFLMPCLDLTHLKNQSSILMALSG